jgi:hypothetical protein
MPQYGQISKEAQLPSQGTKPASCPHTGHSAVAILFSRTPRITGPNVGTNSKLALELRERRIGSVSSACYAALQSRLESHVRYPSRNRHLFSWTEDTRQCKSKCEKYQRCKHRADIDPSIRFTKTKMRPQAMPKHEPSRNGEDTKNPKRPNR